MTDNNETAAKITVHEVCGAGPLNGTHGIKIHKLILGAWGPAKTVEVDFEKVLPSVTFLDEAIGQLIPEFKKAEIISKLKLTGISAADKTILNGVLVNRYHALANAGRAKNRP